MKVLCRQPWNNVVLKITCATIYSTPITFPYTKEPSQKQTNKKGIFLIHWLTFLSLLLLLLLLLIFHRCFICSAVAKCFSGTFRDLTRALPRCKRNARCGCWVSVTASSERRCSRPWSPHRRSQIYAQWWSWRGYSTASSLQKTNKQNKPLRGKKTKSTNTQNCRQIKAERLQRDVSWLMFSNRMLSVCRSCTQTYRPDFCRRMFRKNANMFFSKKKLEKKKESVRLKDLMT